MRINKLEFSAVGPYANHHVIDFDLLGGSALYLIDGPTGAGKSTIIDCIVYALYAEMAGDQSDPARIRSQFAKPEHETWVELTFTTNSGSFKVRRSPAYMRPKARGEGVTEEKASATLWRLDSRGEVAETIETHVREVNPMLSDHIIGLTKSQFVQTVVLPQGEFAKFLRAETKDREQLLEQVFGTGLYKKVSELLEDKAKLARGDRKAITDEIISLLDQYQLMVGYPDDQIKALKKYVADGLDTEFFADIKEMLASFEQEHSIAKAKYSEATSKLDAARKVLKKREDEADAEAKVASSKESVFDSFISVEESIQGLSDFSGLLESLKISTAADQAASVWETHTQSVSEQKGSTQGLLEVEKRVESWPAQEVQLIDQIESSTAQIAKVDEALKAIPSEIERLQLAAADVAPLTIQLHEFEDQLLGLDAQKVLIETLTKLKTDKDAADNKLVDASAKALAAVKEVTDLRERRIRGIAGELATTLTDGLPCAVCGSTEHPHPAQLDDDAVTVTMIEQAESSLKDAEILQSKAKASVDSLIVEIAQVEVQITVDIEHFDDVKSKLAESVSEVTAKISTAQVAAAEIETLNTRQIQLMQDRSELQVNLSSLEQNLKNGKSSNDEDIAKLSAALGDFESIQSKFDSLEGLVNGLSMVANRVGVRERAQQDFTAAKDALDALEKSDEFGNVEPAQSSVTELNAVALDVKTNFDVLSEKLTSAKGISQGIEAKIAQRSKQAGSTQDLENLAKTFTKNSNGQSLNIYVLQSIFENVLSVANRSLESLLEGRYRLVSSDESDGHAAKRRGLGVNVEDIYTGAQRAAKTLSGGETFCASLALALGMAGVVRANAGGVSIDTLFIDEGFGSLDGDRLGDVMNMLQGIKNTGRTIGVISHVDEMKTQIAERIVVKAGGKDKPTTMEVTWMQ